MKEHFPILRDSDIVYLDTAASSQKPEAVVEAVSNYYYTSHSNVHRSAHKLASKATGAFEKARQQVAAFIQAKPESIIFTKGATEALNLLASSMKISGTIISSQLEHHSNFVPWQQRAARDNLELKLIQEVDGSLDMTHARQLISEGVGVLAVQHVSNVTGQVSDLQTLAQLVHDQGGLIIVDGCQVPAHMPIDVNDLGVDAYAFSSHKMYGPTGIGALWVSDDLMHQLDPYQFGGEMIDEVTVANTTWARPPQKFEAGTPPIAQAVGFGVACQFISEFRDVIEGEQDLVLDARRRLESLGCNIYSVEVPLGSVCFALPGAAAHDVASVLDTHNVAVRAGHHCTQILHRKWGVNATIRASFGIYNNQADVDALIAAVKDAKQILGVEEK